MSKSAAPLTGPDLSRGIELADIPPAGVLLGHLDGEPVMLVRPGSEDRVYAMAAKCTHYGGPLNEGRIEGHTVRCPWHHACFDLRTGEAVGAPALNAAACWAVERRGSRIELAGRVEIPTPALPPHSPESVVVGSVP